MTVLIPPPQRQVIGTYDGKPVYATVEWYRYWAQGLLERTGGTVAPTNNEILIDLPDDVGIEEMKHEYRKDIEAAALASQVFALREEVAELRKEIDGLKSGTML